MQKILIFFIALLFTTLSIKGQNLFFIGENSYPCTKTFTLQSNSDEFYINDLNVLFARDGKTPLFAVSTETKEVLIRGKLIIYLDDGTVITLTDNGNYEYVDKIASTVYYLTNEELSKMKNSNINTVRFTLESEDGSSSPFGGNFSASNKGTQIKNIISEFFNNAHEVKRDDEGNERSIGDKGQTAGDPYATTYYGSPGSGSGTGGYGLSGRSLVGKGKVQQECNQEGRVVVKIVVDRNGKVIQATPGVKGTTNNDPCLMEPAKKTAFLHSWNKDSKAPNQQIGFVVVNFKLGE